MQGLSTAEARRRLAEQGANTVAEGGAPGWRRLAAKFWAPVPWMLEAAIAVQLALGERTEAAVILGLLVFNAVLGFAQEARAKATLDALKARLALVASVRRDGAWTTVPAAELVAGDMVKLSLGGIAGADVTVAEGSVLVDLSMLTGESLPVEAGPGAAVYAGALVRRGEAVGEVTATGPRTRFGRTADLVRTARAASSQQAAVLRVVRNLTLFNLAMLAVQVAYAGTLGMGLTEMAALALTAMLAAIPVALPASFTLTSALAARSLAKRGVLPTRLSAVDEAGGVDVLCVDKTGTLTENALHVAALRPAPGHGAAELAALAALASSDGGQDPVDAAIRAAATPVPGLPALRRFLPFDPQRKTAEAEAEDAAGRPWRIVKGAFATVAALAGGAMQAEADALQAEGNRVLAVAAGAEGRLEIVGLIALGDPPRADSAPMVAALTALGVRTVMVTGDARATAEVVARAVGLPGPVHAGVFPEDKFRIVRELQGQGHVVGMCGDGANDAPALRQAQMGIAVSTATDVAKSAAGMVLTEPGLGGIVAAVREGRATFQRILTYTLRSLAGKTNQLLFLTAGLVMTGHAILTPKLMVVLMVTGDFLAMASSADRVEPSPLPNRWRIDRMTLAGLGIGLANLAFCCALLAAGHWWLGYGAERLQTLSMVILVCGMQATLYSVRERRRLWSSRPGWVLVASSVVDLAVVTALALSGALSAPLPAAVVALVMAAALLWAPAVDTVKAALFRRLGIA